MEQDSNCCKAKIQWREPSTLRGLVWVAAAVIGVIMIWLGRDIGPLMILAAGVAGGLGVGISDKKS
jgi:drug/metabolite transporter (DMT)-like permease